jgi:membrane protease YdiL (CAAX protease family)
MVVIKEYLNPVDLAVDKDKLDYAQIYYITTDEFYDTPVPDIHRGICLMVNEEDEERAREVLSKEISEQIIGDDGDEIAVESGEEEETDEDRVSGFPGIEKQEQKDTLEKVSRVVLILFIFGLHTAIQMYIVPRFLYVFIHAGISFVETYYPFFFRIIYVLLIMFILYCVSLFENKKLQKSLELNPFPIINLVPLIITTIGFYFLSNRIYDFITAVILAQFPLTESQFLWVYPPEGVLNFFIPALLVAPIIEELFFRGFILKRLLSNISSFAALLLSGILFGIAHV